MREGVCIFVKTLVSACVRVADFCLQTMSPKINPLSSSWTGVDETRTGALGANCTVA